MSAVANDGAVLRFGFLFGFSVNFRWQTKKADSVLQLGQSFKFD